MTKLVIGKLTRKTSKLANGRTRIHWSVLVPKEKFDIVWASGSGGEYFIPKKFLKGRKQIRLAKCEDYRMKV